MATNLYISSTGNDSNNGLSPSTPFRTAQKAFNVAWFRTDACVLNFADYVGGDYGGINYYDKDTFVPTATTDVVGTWYFSGASGGIAFSPADGIFVGATNSWNHNQDGVIYTLEDRDIGWQIEGSDGSIYSSGTGAFNLPPWEHNWGVPQEYYIEKNLTSSQSIQWWHPNSGGVAFSYTGNWSNIVNNYFSYNADYSYSFIPTIISGKIIQFSIVDVSTNIVDQSPVFPPNKFFAPWQVDWVGPTSYCTYNNSWPSRITIVGQSIAHTNIGGILASQINADGLNDSAFSAWVGPSYGGTWNIPASNCNLGGLYSVAGAGNQFVAPAGAASINLNGVTCGDISVYGGNGDGTDASVGGSITLHASHARSIISAGGLSGLATSAVGGPIVLDSGSTADSVISTSASTIYPAGGGEITISNSSANTIYSIGGTGGDGGSGAVGLVHLVGNVSPVPTTLVGNVDLSQFSPSGGGNGGFISSLLRLPFPITI